MRRNQIKILYISLSVLMFTGLLSFFYKPFNSWLHQKELLAHREKDTPYSPHSLKLFKEYLNFVEKKHGLYCDGTGGRFGDKIKFVKFSLVGVRNYSIEEARALHLDCAEELLKRLNNDPHLRDYLEPYPFTHQQAEIMLTFDDENHNFAPLPFICLVYNIENKIYYRKNNSETQKFIAAYEEKYEEGLALVHNKLPLQTTKNSFFDRVKNFVAKKT